MPLERAKLESALTAKGFQGLEGAKHTRFRLFVDGKLTSVMTFVSRGSGYRVLDDSLLAAISRQLHLSKAELLRLAECTLTGGAYVQLLRDRKVLPPPVAPPSP
jgi:hypothetical protein